jgi:hypothetical protein
VQARELTTWRKAPLEKDCLPGEVLNPAAAVAVNSCCGRMAVGDLGLDRDSCSLVAAAAAVVDDAEGGVARAPSVMCSSGPGGVAITSNGACDDVGSLGPGPVLPVPGRLGMRGSPGLGRLMLAPPLVVMPDPDAMLGHRNVLCGLQMRKLLFLAARSGPPWTTIPYAGWLV